MLVHIFVPIEYATSERSDEPVHPHSLDRAFTFHQHMPNAFFIVQIF